MKPTVQNIINQARQIARSESQEFLKNTYEQVKPQPESQLENKPSEPKEPETPPINDYLEEEMQRYRELRRQKEEEIEKQRQVELEQKQMTGDPVPTLPTSGRPHGAKNKGMQSKIQTMQMGGEVRANKSKD